MTTWNDLVRALDNSSRIKHHCAIPRDFFVTSYKKSKDPTSNSNRMEPTARAMHSV